MKIALCLHYFQNYGGLIGQVEDTIYGLKELGHEADLYVLTYTKTPKSLSKFGQHQVTEIGATGVQVSQFIGWELFPWNNSLCYGTPETLARTKDVLSKYDAIMWQNAVPTKQNANAGNIVWPELYDINEKQIVCVNDGNYRKAYPWLYLIKDKVKAFACVHECAYNSTSNIDRPRALIASPQSIPLPPLGNDWEDREFGFLSVQTFKRWKRVDELLRAVQYMPRQWCKYLAGGGIEWRYMTSPDKTKPEYMDGDRRIIDIAVEDYGLRRLEWITPTERNEILSRILFLIDASWSKAYAAIGGHWNRTAMEAVLHGAIPVLRNYGVSMNEGGYSNVWNPDENYIMVPWNASPMQFAAIVMDAALMGKDKYNEMRTRNLNKFRTFVDRRYVCQRYINLFEGKPIEIYDNLSFGIEYGNYDPEFDEMAQLEFNLAF